jgi:hypothetical protein
MMEALPSNRSIIATITDKMDKIQTKSQMVSLIPEEKSQHVKAKAARYKIDWSF